MTVVTARAAGCPYVVLCSPKPAPITLAAAHVSGADLVLSVGGAQAIGAMAYGVSAKRVVGGGGDDAGSDASPLLPEVPPCDVIVGPGNRWVTAAKSIVSGRCGIDMLAGPSEVLVIADSTADPAVIASDLVAQAEHDVVARAILVSDDPALIDAVDDEVTRQVSELPEPNRSTASEALGRSFAVLCRDVDECIAVSDRLAPEHLEVQTADPADVGRRCSDYGGLFVGADCAEVLGDYGAGPNHTLPTGGTGRYTGGLSVFNFLRIRTWMRIDDGAGGGCQDMVEDCVRMARLEGLEGHARAAERRRR
jgi:histidinol dehydrogenase